MGIQFALYDQPGGTLIADYSNRVSGLSLSSGKHGHVQLSGFIALGRSPAFALASYAAPLHIVATGRGAEVVFEGRLEDVALTMGGVNITALGYSRALGDAPYTALWSTTDVSQFRPVLASEVTGAVPDRFAFDTNNRIYITAQKNATLGNTTAKFGMACFQLPDDSTRDIIGASFDYEYATTAANWRFAFQTRNADFSAIANVWIVTTGGGGTVNGSIFATFAAAKVVNFFMDFNAADAVFAGETGVTKLTITNLRLVTATTNKVDTTHTAARAAGANVTATVGSTARMYVGQRLFIGADGVTLGESVIVEQILSSTQFVADFTAAAAVGIKVQSHVIYADEIVKDMIGAISTLNPIQLSNSTTAVQSPALDLFDEWYEDQYPTDILDRLITLGDNQTTPRQWEWGVADLQRLYYRPQAVRGLWYIDVADLDVQFSIDALYNSVYALYQEAGGRTLRATASADTFSIARYLLTRRMALDTQTSSSVLAGIQQAAALNDRSDAKPRATLVVTQVFDASGARWPLTFVRAGDTMIIRNLPPTLTANTVIDRLRTFRIARAEWHADDGTLTIEPETPLPSLDALLALAVPPSYVTSSWWTRS